MRKVVWFVLGLTSLVLAGCGSEVSNGNQLAGQRCFASGDCAPGLTCYGRQCVPKGDPANNQNNGNNRNNGNNQNNQSDMGTDMTFDLPPNCVPESAVCIDAVTRAVCLEGPSGEGDWTTGACPPNSRCQDGLCSEDPFECIDIDGDSYGEGCPAGQDCNDSDPRVNSGMAEACRTPFDDNCNGYVNEGCDEGCCIGGCNDSAFCTSQCMCSDYDPSFCASQNQPCEFEEQFSNGFICVSWGQTAELRCVGLCDKNDPNPDSTCPGDIDVTCTFGDDEQGVCVSTCDAQGGCGDGTLGCMPWGSSPDHGICLPVDPSRPIGSPCDTNQDLAGCGAGALCIPQGPNGPGICRQACRPFEYTDVATGGTDCNSGTHCLPFSADVGVCQEDNDDVEGGRCFPGGSTCQEDAVGCYPSFQGMTRCQRVCRLDVGDSDCRNLGESCVQFDNNQTELGVCVGNP